MTPAQRRGVALVVGVFAIGALGNLLLGRSPAASVAQLQPEAEWAVPAPDLPDLAALDSGWEARAPWGARPKPPEVAPPPPPPPPAPVGIVRGQKGRQQVIFLAADVGTVRVAPGEALPGGGKLLGVSGMRVTWVDAEGKEQQREMFIDPPPVLPGASGTASAAPAMALPNASGLLSPQRARPGGGNQQGQARTPSPRGTRSGAQPPSRGNADAPAASTTSAPDASAATAGAASAATAAPGAGNVTTVSAQSLRRSNAAGRATPPSSDRPSFGQGARPPGTGSRQRPPSDKDAQRPGQ